MLNIENTIENDVLILKLDGRLDGMTSGTFSDKVNDPSIIDISRVVVDCSALNYISSEGLRALLILAKRVKSLNGALTLCSLNSSVNEVMAISGFGTLLGVHADIQQAINAIS